MNKIFNTETENLMVNILDKIALSCPNPVNLLHIISALFFAAFLCFVKFSSESF